VDGEITALVKLVSSAVGELFGVSQSMDSHATVTAQSQAPLTDWQRGAIGCMVGGAVLVGVGGVGTWQVKDAKDAGDYSRWKAWRAVSIAGYAVGGAAIITGVVLWFTDPERDSEVDTVQFGVAPQPGGASAQLDLRF
jgi:hypothetical protein